MKLFKQWQHVQLGSICSKIGSGATPRGGESVYIEKGTAIIRSQNVYNGLFTNNGLAHIMGEHAEQLKGVTVESRDVLLNITGDSVARCCQVPDWVLPARVNQHVAIVRPSLNQLLPKFLFYYFISPLMQKYLLSRAGSGGTRNALTKEMIEALEVPCPSLAIQQRIVDILKNYDSLIENNRRSIQLLEQSARLLYREWFVHLRFPGHEHVRIIDGVPEGWEKKQLVDIANLVMGQSPKSEYYNEEGEGLPFHQGVTNFGDRFVNHEFYCTVKNRLANPGDILCSVRAPVGRLNVTLDKIVIGRGLAAIHSISNHQSFLYFQLKNHFFKEDMIGGGAIFASVTKKDMENQELMYPPEGLVKNFEEISMPIDNQLRTLHLQNNRLREARDILLPHLMNGEITV